MKKNVEYLDWYFTCDDGTADKEAQKAWSELRERIVHMLKEQENDEVREQNHPGYMDKWISIDERLPDKEGYYVVFHQWYVRDANRNREFTVTTSDVTWYSELSGFGDDTVTHWLPLPEPPEI